MHDSMCDAQSSARGPQSARWASAVPVVDDVSDICASWVERRRRQDRSAAPIAHRGNCPFAPPIRALGRPGHVRPSRILPAMSGRVSFQVDATGGVLAGWSEGEGPPVLLLHGGPGLGYVYLEELFAELSG